MKTKNLISILFFLLLAFGINAQTKISYERILDFQSAEIKPNDRFGSLKKSANETWFVLDSMLQTNYNGSNLIVSKSHYKYSSEGKLTERIDYNSDVSGNMHLQYKHEYILDENEIHFFYIYYQWNSNTMQWTKNNKSEYILYPDGKLKEENLFSYDSTSMDWRNSMKKEIGYDENGRFKHDTTCVWKESNNTWQYYMNTESELDEKGNILWGVSFVFEYSSDDWTILDKVEFAYENGKRARMESFSWSSTLNQWKKWQVDEYFYDNNENEVAWVRTTWNDVLSDWIFDYKSEKEYNSNNQLILETNYDWENENTEWVPITKIAWDYDNTGNIKSEINHNWNTNTNDWQLGSTSEYFYSEFITNINNDLTELKNIKIYPNPAHETFTIELLNH